jgi:hypothetical protein
MSKPEESVANSRNLYKARFFISLAALGVTGAVLLVSVRTHGFSGIAPGGPKGSSNMPVGVNGGAMTIRALGSYGSEYENDDDHKYPCVVLEPGPSSAVNKTSIELDDVTDGAGVPNPKTRGTTLSQAPYRDAVTPWTMRLVTRGRDGSAGDEGMMLTWTSNCIQQGQRQNGITITIFGNNSEFYPYDLRDVNNPINEDGSVRLRYKSKVSTETRCRDLPDGTGDEDMCERLSIITITQRGGTHSYRCTSGECSIGFQE